MIIKLYGNPLRMITFYLAEAGDVVDEVGKCHVCLGPQNTDATEKQEYQLSSRFGSLGQM